MLVLYGRASPGVADDTPHAIFLVSLNFFNVISDLLSQQKSKNCYSTKLLRAVTSTDSLHDGKIPDLDVPQSVKVEM